MVLWILFAITVSLLVACAGVIALAANDPEGRGSASKFGGYAIAAALVCLCATSGLVGALLQRHFS